MNEIFQNMETSVLTEKIDDLRVKLSQASMTFTYNGMETFSRASEVLQKQTIWEDWDMVRAQCLALYHMYLMFYRNPDCGDCRKFLERLCARYQQALTMTH